VRPYGIEPRPICSNDGFGPRQFGQKPELADGQALVVPDQLRDARPQESDFPSFNWINLCGDWHF
jgi:hypothetical protein